MSVEGWDPRRRPDAGSVGREATDSEQWWLLNGTVRFYGFVLLLGTKTADAATTAVGLRYVPGIVEVNPVADAVFAGGGTVAGLAVLSFATVAIAVLTAELLAVEIRRTLRRDRLALAAKIVIYGTLSALFGAIAVNNALLISTQVQGYIAEMFTVAA